MNELKISVLGAVHFQRAGQAVGDGLYAKATALLVYLAMEADRPHSRALLAEMLWPEQDAGRSRHSLRQALSTIRRVLGGDPDDGSLLVATREAVQFIPSDDVVVDAVEVAALIDACTRHDHAHITRCPACAGRLASVAELYRGEFLEGFSVAESVAFDDWASVWRQRLHQWAVEALDTVSHWHEERGALDQASDAMSRLLQLDPWVEESHRRQMELLWRQGRRSEAIDQFERCRLVLDTELGDEPDAETRALLERILSSKGEPASAPKRRDRSAGSVPAERGKLIGRERDLEAIGDLVSRRNCRLLTLTGPGGMGKSRLAEEVARGQVERIAGSVHFVALDAVSGAEEVAPAIAAELGVRLDGLDDPTRQLVQWARDRSLFLVLDNAEHVVAALDVVSALLDASPDTKVLVTSRERLQVRGEWLYEVAGLDYPEAGALRPGDRFGAVDLLVERVEQVRPGAVDADSDGESLAAICRLVEGSPLAIELAAAWAQTLTLEQIAQGIRENLDFLTSSLRDVPARHRSIRAVFNQTWLMLSPQERETFRGISIFQDGFDLDAAEAVVGATPAQLANLVGKSLLARTADGRFRLHQLLRQFAVNLLAEQPDEHADLRRKHGQWFLQRLADQDALLVGLHQRKALETIERDLGNIRVAWQWAIQTRSAELIERSAHALWLYWVSRGGMQEGVTAFGDAVRYLDGHGGRDQQLARAMSLTRYGGFLSGIGNYEGGAQLIHDGIDLLRALDDVCELGLALNMLAATRQMVGELDESRLYLAESLAHFEQINDVWGMAFSFNDLGLNAHLRGEQQDAGDYCQKARSMFRSVGDLRGEAMATYNLGMIAAAEGEHRRAQRMFRESLALRHESRDRWGIAVSLVQLGVQSRLVGSVEEARITLLRALRIARESSIAPVMLEALVGLASLMIDGGEQDRAEAILEAVARHPATPGQLKETIRELAPDIMPGADGEFDSRAVVTVEDIARELGEVGERRARWSPAG